MQGEEGAGKIAAGVDTDRRFYTSTLHNMESAPIEDIIFSNSITKVRKSEALCNKIPNPQTFLLSIRGNQKPTKCKNLPILVAHDISSVLAYHMNTKRLFSYASSSTPHPRQ